MKMLLATPFLHIDKVLPKDGPPRIISEVKKTQIGLCKEQNRPKLSGTLIFFLIFVQTLVISWCYIKKYIEKSFYLVTFYQKNIVKHLRNKSVPKICK